ncbi:MAG TPA: dTMP kinase [Thermaerobacter sp.]
MTDHGTWQPGLPRGAADLPGVPPRRRGWFITLEGGEGSGKSTHAGVVAQVLDELGMPYRLVREPGGTPLGERVRQLLLAGDVEIDPVAEVYLFAAARAQLVASVILPALRAGETVIADRYVDSSLAYQGYGLGIDPAQVWAVNRWATRGLVPDLTLLFDCAPEVARRRHARPTDRIEGRDEAFHHRVRAGYLELARMHADRYVVIDAQQPPERVAESVRAAVRQRLGAAVDHRKAGGHW